MTATIIEFKCSMLPPADHCPHSVPRVCYLKFCPTKLTSIFLGSGDGQFKFPRGVAVDENGFIIVGDSGNNRIQIFNPDGTFLKVSLLIFVTFTLI